MPREDAGALAAAMARIAGDRALAAALAQAGRAAYLARFSRQAVVERYLALFDRITATRNPEAEIRREPAAR